MTGIFKKVANQFFQAEVSLERLAYRCVTRRLNLATIISNLASQRHDTVAGNGDILARAAAAKSSLYSRRPLGAGQLAAGFQVVGQAFRLVAGPGLKGKHELALVDQAVLKRQQSEEEMAVGGGGHDKAPIVVGRSGAGPSLGAGPGIKLHRADYRRFAMRLHPWRRARSDSPGGLTKKEKRTGNEKKKKGQAM